MSENIQDYPVVSIDTHFRNVPNFQYIDFNAQSYATMLIDLGVPADKAGSNNNVYIRPDYQQAYSKWERIKAWLKSPDDYTDAASCVENDQGGVDITLVYGTSYGINKLLRHETHHALVELTSNEKESSRLMSLTSANAARKIAQQEEDDADKLMNDKYLKAKYGKVVTVKVEKH